MRDCLNSQVMERGNCDRTTRRVEFGSLILYPWSKIGKHGHYDTNSFKHCEIYFTLSPNVWFNKNRQFFIICRNGEHEAENFSDQHKARIIWIKLWW